MSAVISKQEALKAIDGWFEAGVLSPEEVITYARNRNPPTQPAITGGEVVIPAATVVHAPWTRSLSDDQVLKLYADRKEPNSGKAVAELLPQVRAMFMAEDSSYTGPVVVHRRVGYTYTFKPIDPQEESFGWENFKYLQHWDPLDVPGPEVLIFGAPVIVPSLFDKDYNDQQTELRRREKMFCLPKNLLSFGSARDGSALMLAAQRTGIWVGKPGKSFRTETKRDHGPRLELYWEGDYLNCCTRSTSTGDNADSYVGGLPMWVLAL